MCDFQSCLVCEMLGVLRAGFWLVVGGLFDLWSTDAYNTIVLCCCASVVCIAADCGSGRVCGCLVM